ncbi:MAG TPA: glycosyltransferase family 2 protein [Abditibacteriaceae bacterium]|jgi:glycosyltransferase involved in cell wall biosynthesis
MKLISIVTPCYNEEGNVEELCALVRGVMAQLPQYEYEHLFIDNASQDKTALLLKGIAASDPRVKVIINNRNFGHIRSPYHALLQARGDAIISLASDLQDPPELIKEFIKRWEEGFPVVLGQKAKSEESPLFFFLRRCYYRTVNRLAEVELIENVTGFGLYDKSVMDTLRRTNDPYPYVRGLISELGFSVARVTYTQPMRKRGISKNNFYTLYDLAMLGLTSHSKVPLRLATMLGFAMSALSFLAALGYLFYKLIFWNSFQVGVAPLVIGLFFISSVQLLFLGIVGEYIGFIHTQVMHRPLVTERERINFDVPVEGETPTALMPPVNAVSLDKSTAEFPPVVGQAVEPQVVETLAVEAQSRVSL